MTSTTISGYTTTRNCKEMDYPFIESIHSLLSFCDEVCVLDSSDKDDGTLVALQQLKAKEPRVKLKHANIDWTAPNHGIFDGQTKQLARGMCSSMFCWQMDVDEIVHEEHSELVHKVINQVGSEFHRAPLLALPVVEYWGSSGTVRLDVNCWKWRLSLNTPNIVHGIPKELRHTDPTTGLLYAKHGTDTCDYINRVTGERIPMIQFVPPQMEQTKREACRDTNKVSIVEQWFNETLTGLPGVFHYSWFNIERKIKQYRLFWASFWKAMYNETRDERNNPFFPGLLWSEVTDEMIGAKAVELETKTSGHVFHVPWDGTTVTNGMRVNRFDHPAIIKPWLSTQTKCGTAT